MQPVEFDEKLLNNIPRSYLGREKINSIWNLILKSKFL